MRTGFLSGRKVDLERGEEPADPNFPSRKEAHQVRCRRKYDDVPVEIFEDSEPVRHVIKALRNAATDSEGWISTVVARICTRKGACYCAGSTCLQGGWKYGVTVDGSESNKSVEVGYMKKRYHSQYSLAGGHGNFSCREIDEAQGVQLWISLRGGAGSFDTTDGLRSRLEPSPRKLVRILLSCSSGTTGDATGLVVALEIIGSDLGGELLERENSLCNVHFHKQNTLPTTQRNAGHLKEYPVELPIAHGPQFRQKGGGMGFWFSPKDEVIRTWTAARWRELGLERACAA
ncbi:hypothetical protein K438DRAFT_1749909 [Mycena galopus ATCC 62051]|nr:hypothetical protein K438DRAFT_1749909 [Mycena galopus ATCC 62051]